MPENGTAKQIELMTVIIISIVVSFVTSIITSFFTFVLLKKISKKSKKKTSETKEETKVVSAKTKHHTEAPKTDKVNSVVNTQENASGSSSKEELQQPKEKKLSKKEQQKLLRKEERTKKIEEKARREEELAEEKRRKSFNPKVSRPENAIFSDLAVYDGHLESCAVGQTAYYRFWEYDGKRYFEFYCEPSKAPKAFNNRSVIIDPFCQKDNDSVPVDEAKTYTTLEFGEIDANLNIISKSLVRFDK